MSDATKRIDNWDTGYDTERIKAKVDQKRPKMLERVNATFSSIYDMELQVKQTCDAQGVATILYPFYLNFGREMWSLRRKGISGESLAIETETLLEKWVSRGLVQSVLEAIRVEVFDVSAPAGP